MRANVGTLNKAIKKALAHQNAGRLGEAERILRHVLKSEPHDPVANHGLSLVSVKQGEVLAAIPFFLTAVNANQWEHHYWLSFVEALIDADAVDEAQFVLEKASASGLSGPELSPNLKRG